MDTLAEYEELSARLDDLLRLDGLDTGEALSARREELLEAQEDVMAVKAMASEQLYEAIGRFKERKGGTPFRKRAAWGETVNRCKTDLFAINRALHSIRVKARSLAQAENVRPPTQDLARTALHFVALCEKSLDPAVFGPLLDRARALSFARVRIHSKAVEQMAEQMKAEALLRALDEVKP